MKRSIDSSSFPFRPLFYVATLILLTLLLGGCSGGSSDDDATMNCTASNSPVLQLVSTTGTACDESAGSIRVSASGNGAVRFSIDGINFQDDGIFESLEQGPYTVVAKNDLNCMTEMQVTVKSDISFSQTILPIIQTDCAISGCHVSGAQAPDLTVRSNIFSAATRIKNQVETRNMPRGRTLTSTEIQHIICWFNDGAPDN